MLDPFVHRKILSRGLPAHATVLAISAPDTAGEQPTQVTMKLAVELPGGPLYEVEDRWLVSGTEPIGDGSILRIVVDPSNHHHVAIDWERSHPDYRRRSAVRRRVLAGAMPIPVPSARDAIEDGIGSNQGPPSTATPPIDHGVAPDENDLTSRLERLAILHAAGSLTDDEFTAAKRHVLAGC